MCICIHWYSSCLTCSILLSIVSMRQTCTCVLIYLFLDAHLLSFVLLKGPGKIFCVFHTHSCILVASRTQLVYCWRCFCFSRHLFFQQLAPLFEQSVRWRLKTNSKQTSGMYKQYCGKPGTAMTPCKTSNNPWKCWLVRVRSLQWKWPLTRVIQYELMSFEWYEWWQAGMWCCECWSCIGADASQKYLWLQKRIDIL